MEIVLDDAMWGVFQEGYRKGYGADIDHVKKQEDTFWTVEMAIPFTCFKEEKRRANFNRNRPISEEADRLRAEMRGWRYVNGSNHNVDKFGVILFQ